MSTLLSSSRSTKPIRLATSPAAPSRPITSEDPWTDRPAYSVAKASLTFAARVRHKVIPGVWKVVREATRLDSTRRYAIRVREFADDGSLIGPVLNWTLDEVAAIVTDEPAPTPEPVEVVATVNTPAEPRDVVFVDEDGSILPTLAEIDAGHKAAHLARVRALLDGNPFLPTARQVEQVPCCPAEETEPCAGCVNVHTLPDDLSGDDWEDDWRYELGPDSAPEPDGWLPSADEMKQAEEDGFFEQSYGEAPLAHATPECFRAVAAGRADWAREFGYVPSPGWVTTENAEDLIIDEVIAEGWGEYRDRERAEAMRARAARLLADNAPDVTVELDLSGQVADVADAYRSNGTAFGAFLAKHLDELADRIGFLGATTIDAYHDRHQALLDSVRSEAEARSSARC